MFSYCYLHPNFDLQIVEAVYEPVEEGAFSERVTDMIRW